MAYAPWNAYDAHGSTVYALFDYPDGTAFDKTSGTLKAPATTTLANRAVAVLEDASNPGIFPVAIPNLPPNLDAYKVTVYHQNGASPAGGAADDVTASFEGVWTGAAMQDRPVNAGVTLIERTVVMQQS